jgi:hypothetical protein
MKMKSHLLYYEIAFCTSDHSTLHFVAAYVIQGRLHMQYTLSCARTRPLQVYARGSAEVGRVHLDFLLRQGLLLVSLQSKTTTRQDKQDRCQPPKQRRVWPSTSHVKLRHLRTPWGLGWCLQKVAYGGIAEEQLRGLHPGYHYRVNTSTGLGPVP